jgi:hypothetical protein
MKTASLRRCVALHAALRFRALRATGSRSCGAAQPPAAAAVTHTLMTATTTAGVELLPVQAPRMVGKAQLTQGLVATTKTMTTTTTRCAWLDSYAAYSLGSPPGPWPLAALAKANPNSCQTLFLSSRRRRRPRLWN